MPATRNSRFFRHPADLSKLSQQHDQVVVLREAVISYLQHIGRGELSDAEAGEHADLVAAAGKIEGMSAAISCELAPLARSLKEADITASSETTELLERLFQPAQPIGGNARRADWPGRSPSMHRFVPRVDGADVPPHRLALASRDRSGGPWKPPPG